jgi:hypothetical protein
MCLTETLDEMVQSGTLRPELAIQVLVQFDKVRLFAVLTAPDLDFCFKELPFDLY